MPTKLPDATSLGTARPQPARSKKGLTYRPAYVPNTYAATELPVPEFDGGRELATVGTSLHKEADKIQRAATKAQEKEDVMGANRAISDLQIFQATSFEQEKEGDVKSFTKRVVEGFDGKVQEMAESMSPGQASLFLNNASSVRTSSATRAIKHQSEEIARMGKASYVDRQTTNAAAAAQDIDNLPLYYKQASADAANAYRVDYVDDYAAANTANHKQISKSVANQLLMTDPQHLKKLVEEDKLKGLTSAEKLEFDTRSRAAINKIGEIARQDKTLSIIEEERTLSSAFTAGAVTPQMVEDYRNSGPDDTPEQARDRNTVADYLDDTLYMTPDEVQEHAVNAKIASIQSTREAKKALGIQPDVTPSGMTRSMTLSALTSRYVQMFGHSPTKSVKYTKEGLPDVAPEKETSLTDILAFQRDVKIAADAKLITPATASTYFDRLLPGIAARVKRAGFFDQHRYGFEGARRGVDVDVEPYAPVFLSVMEHIDETTRNETDAERANILEQAMTAATRTDLFAIEDMGERQEAINKMVDGVIKGYEAQKAPILRSFQGDIPNNILRSGGKLDALQPGGSVKAERVIETPQFVLQDSYDLATGGVISKDRIMETAALEGDTPEEVVRNLEISGVIGSPRSVRQFELDQRSMDRVKLLHPDLQKVLTHAIGNGLPPSMITEGLRDLETQKKNVAKGVSQTMNSRHLTGHAFDFALTDSDGNPNWDNFEDYRAAADIIKKSAKELGIDINWGGDWKSLKDGPHIELDRKKYPK